MSLVETEFRFDGVQLSEDRQALPNQTFTFPVNPNDGYIDGSIYLCCVHAPADVTSTKFGDICGDLINAEFSIHLNFEFEGPSFQNTTIAVSVPLRINDAHPVVVYRKGSDDADRYQEPNRPKFCH